MNVIHGTEQRRAHRREEKTEAVLDSAMRLLAEDGLSGLTLAKLAAREGLVPAALYRYFPSKDALIAAMQRRTVKQLHARLAEHLRELEPAVARLDAKAQALARLLSLGGFYVEVSEAAPEAFYLVQALLGDPRPLVSDEDAALTAPFLVALLADVGELFAAAERVGALPKGDAKPRTLLAWASLQGVLSLRKMGRFDATCADSRALSSLALRTLLLGLGADAAPLSRAETTLRKTDETNARK